MRDVLTIFLPPLICQKWLMSYRFLYVARVYPGTSGGYFFSCLYKKTVNIFDMQGEEWYSCLWNCEAEWYGRKNGLVQKYSILLQLDYFLALSLLLNHFQASFLIYKRELIIFNLSIICFVLSHRCSECSPMARYCDRTELLWALNSIPIKAYVNLKCYCIDCVDFIM